MAASAYLILLFLLPLFFFLRKEIAAHLRDKFFSDYERSFMIFHPSDKNSKCTGWNKTSNRRCKAKIPSHGQVFGPILRGAILSSRQHPTLPAMLSHYARLSRCHTHQDNGIHSMVERWTKELAKPIVPQTVQRSSSDLAYGVLTLVQGPVEWENEILETVNAAGQETTPCKPLVSLPELTSPIIDRSRSPSTETEAPSALELPQGFERYRFNEVINPLNMAIMSPLDDKERKPGFIYVLTNTSHEGLVKIGYTKDPLSRLQRLRTCQPEYEVYISLETDLAKRVESIIHADLWESRYQYSCQCETIHTECFQISVERAKQVAEYWVSWLKEVNPYQNGMLRVECIQWMFCQPPVTLQESAEEKKKQCSLFLKDSVGRPWVDLASMLSKSESKSAQKKRGRRKTSSAEVLPTLQNAAPNQTPSLPEKIGNTITSDKALLSEGGCPTPPHQSPDEELSSLDMTFPTTSNPGPDKARRRLFTAQQRGAPSATLWPPSTPEGHLSRQPRSSNCAREERNDDEGSVSLNPNALRTASSGKKRPRRPAPASSSKSRVLDGSSSTSPSADDSRTEENEERDEANPKIGNTTPANTTSARADSTSTADSATPASGDIDALRIPKSRRPSSRHSGSSTPLATRDGILSKPRPSQIDVENDMDGIDKADTPSPSDRRRSSRRKSAVGATPTEGGGLSTSNRTGERLKATSSTTTRSTPDEIPVPSPPTTGPSSRPPSPSSPAHPKLNGARRVSKSKRASLPNASGLPPARAQPTLRVVSDTQATRKKQKQVIDLTMSDSDGGGGSADRRSSDVRRPTTQPPKKRQRPHGPSLNDSIMVEPCAA